MCRQVFALQRDQMSARVTFESLVLDRKKHKKDTQRPKSVALIPPERDPFDAKTRSCSAIRNWKDKILVEILHSVIAASDYTGWREQL